MRRVPAIFGAIALVVSSASIAHPLCMYDGKLYAKTTIEQEFRDAQVIVRGIVLSSKDIDLSDDSDDLDPGVIYRVRVEQQFKGKSSPILVNYTERNSGAFYLSVGTEYLLFLNPITSIAASEFPSWKKFAPEALMVNYNCGQSRPWAKVSLKDRKDLAALSRQDTSR